MKRGFALAIAVFIIFIFLIVLISLVPPGSSAPPGNSTTPTKTIKGPHGQDKNMTFDMPTPTTCSMVWGGNCSEGPPESFKNTFDSCDTGFGGDESINEVYINQSTLLFGSTLEVTCNVVMWGIMALAANNTNMNGTGCGWGWQQDGLNIYYNNGTNLSNPKSWQKLLVINQVYSCLNYSTSFVPDNVSGTQYVRCAIGYGINPPDSCASGTSSGTYYDNDDVNFSMYNASVSQQYISITLSSGTPIDFGSNANAGSNNIPAINNPLVITVDSNVNFDITTKSNSSVFTSGTSSFPVSDMQWQISPSSPLTPYSTSDALVYSNQTPGNFNLYHVLSVPSSQAPGSYSTGVIITAKQTGT